MIEQRNWIAGVDKAGLNYAGVETAHRPTRGGWVARVDLCVVHGSLDSRSVDAELGAGLANLGKFDDGVADAPSLAGAPLSAVDADGGNVFAERAGIKRIAEGRKFGDGFGCEDKHGLARPTVKLGVGMVVPGDAEGSDVTPRYRPLRHAPAGNTDLQNGAGRHPLDIVVEREFVGMRTETDGVSLTLALVADEGFEQLLTENVALQ